MNVAVLGASPKEDRYSNQAVALLKEKGHCVFPINPAAIDAIHGCKVLPTLTAIGDPVDTITVYLSAKHSDGLLDDIVKTKPRRVIFNPGAENSALADALQKHGIETLCACTLVLLRTGQF
ncbi:CoA-binding protein [Oligosphaera ethanolica]|jgi:predicted CoA-binding protein|uniref:CoA-binding protein n=1 Tax=Oligosphaera ethanolica TaxID=760260 RepID=A0AAE3VGM3_9BACT|nr:CoA-binding protein [Oligosphaera ethanolica]MDQ0290117.1 putative CoA-binding protein [Oligosphaera ethanolica]NLE56114.1 CoA-binding protein [Lentisphaerota bacterium]HQL08004.1 CoA-binding protein [Lentisphaeria bacterium]